MSLCGSSEQFANRLLTKFVICNVETVQGDETSTGRRDGTGTGIGKSTGIGTRTSIGKSTWGQLKRYG